MKASQSHTLVGIENWDRIFYSKSAIIFFRFGDERPSCLSLRNTAMGKRLYARGTHGTSAFLIKKGTVEVYLEDAEGNKKVLAKLKENDLFGEMAMISACERTATVIALEDCEIAVLTREKFLALPDNSPAVVRLKNIMKERQKDKK